MKSIEIHADSIIIANEFGDKIKFPDRISFNELPDFINDNFISYIECERKCAAANKCRYKKKTGDKCKLQLAATDVFLKYFKNEISSGDSSVIKNYIEAAINYGAFIRLSFHEYAVAFNKNVLNMFKDYKAGLLTISAESLKDGLVNYLNSMRFIRPTSGIKFQFIVEGDCEEIFFNKILETLSFDQRKYNINNIHGKNNTAGLKMLLNNMKSNNESPFIILDSHKENSMNIDKCIKDDLISSDNCVLFKKDFEDSFPRNIILHFLQTIYKDCSSNDFNKLKNNQSNSSIIKQIQTCLHIKKGKLSSIKKKLATMLGDYYSANIFDILASNDSSEILSVIRKCYNLHP